MLTSALFIIGCNHIKHEDRNILYIYHPMLRNWMARAVQEGRSRLNHTRKYQQRPDEKKQFLLPRGLVQSQVAIKGEQWRIINAICFAYVDLLFLIQTLGKSAWNIFRLCALCREPPLNVDFGHRWKKTSKLFWPVASTMFLTEFCFA